MKALISAIALVLGSAAVVVIVGIQNDPLAFTRLEGRAKDVSALWERPVRVGITAVERPMPANVMVRLEETRIFARVPQSPRPAPVTAPEPEVEVLPAPCNDGEYRLLDETRGVRLSCNVRP